MTKKELISTVAEQTELSKKNVEAAFSAIFEAIKDALSQKDKIAIKGFGTFSVKERAARTGRHPATGETLKIPARTVPFFSSGSDLKDVVANPKKKKTTPPPAPAKKKAAAKKGAAKPKATGKKKS